MFCEIQMCQVLKFEQERLVTGEFGKHMTTTTKQVFVFSALPGYILPQGQTQYEPYPTSSGFATHCGNRCLGGCRYLNPPFMLSPDLTKLLTEVATFLERGTSFFFSSALPGCWLIARTLHSKLT